MSFETSFISKNYREELVDGINGTASRMLFWRNEEYVFGSINEDVLYIKINECSDDYIWNKMGNEHFFNYIIDRLRMRRGEDSNFINFSKRFFFTMKIFNTSQSSCENNLKYTNGIVDSCIFSFSSLKQNAISVIEKFPQRRRGRDQKEEIFKVYTENTFNMPKIKVNPHLLKFYQLVSSTDFESHKFLSFYHILEYFFLSVSDQNLYEKISRRINDPKFRTTPHNLDKLIADINSHKVEYDEAEMLKNVLLKYINEDEVAEFIKDYEMILGENIYTKKKILFGVEIAGTNLQSNHIFGVISKHIKTVRNAIVHSSDRHDRNARFIPYSENSMEIVRNETPLLKFLTEKIIIATAE